MKPPKPPIGVAFGSPCGDRAGPAIARYSSKVKSFASLRSTRPMSSTLPLTNAIAASRPIVVGRAERPAFTLEPADDRDKGDRVPDRRDTHWRSAPDQKGANESAMLSRVAS